MENLPKDILIKIALDFKLSDIINLCLTSQIINRKLCLNQMFWMKKLMEFDINNKNDIPEKYRLKDGRSDYKKYYLYIDYMLKKHTKEDLLEIGSREGELNLVKISINKDQTLNLESKYDKAFLLASCNGHLDVVKLLISEGADVHARNDCALSLASEEGHLEIVKYLIDEGADIHTNYCEALRFASQRGHLDIVRLLIDEGANIRNQALNLASKYGHLEVVRFLIEEGANIHNRALKLAIKYGHTDVVRFLEEQK